MPLLYLEPFSLQKRPRKKAPPLPNLFRHLGFLLIFVISFFFANLYAAHGLILPEAKVSQPPTLSRPHPVPAKVPPAVAEPQGPKICIIMDDVGGDLVLLNKVQQIPFALTLSVLPDCEHTRESADWAHSHGYEVMLHLPMQPEPYRDKDPGEHALMVSMDRNEILQETERALKEIPYAVGVNNHMGSLFTTKRAKLDAVLDVVAREKLYFIDSRTTARSIGYEMAHERGIPSGERTLFLDDIDDKEPIRQRFQELIQAARQDGEAVGICHFRPQTISVLTSLDPDSYRDIRFTFPSQIVR